MADLGAITEIYDQREDSPAPLTLISEYEVIRGRPLGAISVVVNRVFQPALVIPLTTYLVRQLRILYRQLWPSHGQRFPQ